MRRNYSLFPWAHANHQPFIHPSVPHRWSTWERMRDTFLCHRWGRGRARRLYRRCRHCMVSRVSPAVEEERESWGTRTGNGTRRRGTESTVDIGQTRRGSNVSIMVPAAIESSIQFVRRGVNGSINFIRGRMKRRKKLFAVFRALIFLPRELWGSRRC